MRNSRLRGESILRYQNKKQASSASERSCEEAERNIWQDRIARITKSLRQSRK